ncbi:MAG: ribonuclease E inhibitor RraB, partial [Pirellula sp.]
MMHNHQGDDTLFEVFKQLEVDFEKPREVNFYFVFPTFDSAQGAVEDLAKIEFEGEVFRYDPPGWIRLFARPSWLVAT